MNPELSRLLDLLSADIGSTCYISFYSDGSGFVNVERFDFDR